MDKICLSILHKEQNPKNIDEIEKMYASKFDGFYHIVPLYKGQRENFIGVYENKFQISGYLAQAYERIKNDEYTHYAFMMDDCILNPCVNSSNLREPFCIGEESSFISDDLYAVTEDVIADKDWALPSIYNFIYGRNGAEIKELIPRKAEARRMYGELGIKTPYMYFEYIKFLLDFLVFGKKQSHPFYFDLHYGNINVKNLNKIFEPKVEQDKQITIYPYIASEAELFVIPKNVMSDFVYYSGMLAAARIHHNIAFAMALAFSTKSIVMPKDLANIKRIIKNDFELNYGESNLNPDEVFNQNNDILAIHSSAYSTDSRKLSL